MRSYSYKGQTISEDVIQKKAASQGLTLDDYLNDPNVNIDVTEDGEGDDKKKKKEKKQKLKPLPKIPKNSDGTIDFKALADGEVYGYTPQLPTTNRIKELTGEYVQPEYTPSPKFNINENDGGEEWQKYRMSLNSDQMANIDFRLKEERFIDEYENPDKIDQEVITESLEKEKRYNRRKIKLANKTRKIIKNVEPYALKPEVSTKEVGVKDVDYIKDKKYIEDFNEITTGEWIKRTNKDGTSDYFKLSEIVKDDFDLRQQLEDQDFNIESFVKTLGDNFEYYDNTPFIGEGTSQQLGDFEVVAYEDWKNKNLGRQTWEQYFDETITTQIFNDEEDEAATSLDLLLPEGFSTEPTGFAKDQVIITAPNGDKETFQVDLSLVKPKQVRQAVEEISKLKKFVGKHRFSTGFVSNYFSDYSGEDIVLGQNLEGWKWDSWKNRITEIQKDYLLLVETPSNQGGVGLTEEEENSVKKYASNSFLGRGAGVGVGGLAIRSDGSTGVTSAEKEIMKEVWTEAYQLVNLQRKREGLEPFKPLNTGSFKEEFVYFDDYSTAYPYYDENGNVDPNAPKVDSPQAFDIGMTAEAYNATLEQARTLLINKKTAGILENNVEKWAETNSLFYTKEEAMKKGFGAAGAGILQGQTNFLYKAAEAEANVFKVNYLQKEGNWENLPNKNVIENFFTNNSFSSYNTSSPAAVVLSTSNTSVVPTVDNMGNATEDIYVKIQGNKDKKGNELMYLIKKGEPVFSGGFLPDGSKNESTEGNLIFNPSKGYTTLEGQPVAMMPISSINSYNNANASKVQAQGLYYKKVEELMSSIESLPNFSDQVEAWDKNYNELENFGVTLGIAGLSLAKNLTVGAAALTMYVNPAYWGGKMIGIDAFEALSETNTYLSKLLEQEKAGYNFSISSFEDGNFDSWEGFKSYVEWTSNMFADTLPIMAAMILSGGSSSYAAAISSSIAGLSGAGSKITEIDLQNDKLDTAIQKIKDSNLQANDKKIEIEKLESKKVDSGSASYMADAAFGFGNEFVFARLTTGPWSKSMNRMIFNQGNIATKKLYTSWGQRIVDGGSSWLKEGNKEGLGELGVSFFDNMWEGRPLSTGLLEAYSGGFAINGILDGAGKTYSGMAKVNYASNKEIKDMSVTQNNLLEQHNILDDINSQIKVLETPTAPGVPVDAGSYSEINKLKTKKEEVKSEISELNNEMKVKAESYKNKLQADGMRLIPATMYTNNQKRMSELRVKALNLATDPNVEKKGSEANIELNKINTEYKQLENINQGFLNSDVFGHEWFARKGEGVYNKKVKKENKVITDQAVKNIQEQKNNSDYVPNESEIDAEAVKIIDEKTYEENNAKAAIIADQGGWNYSNNSTNKEGIKSVELAYNEAIKNADPNEKVVVKVEDGSTAEVFLKDHLESKKQEAIEGVREGVINGFFDEDINTQFNFKENAIKNQKTGVPLHEGAHGATKKLIQADPEGFKESSKILVAFLKSQQPEVFAKMQVEGTDGLKNSDGSWDFEEVFSSFVEEVAAGNIDLDSQKDFTAFFGMKLNEALMKASDNEFRIDFKGTNDITNFFTKLGQEIGMGEVSLETLAELEARAEDQGPEVIDINRDEQIDQDQKVAASETKLSKSDPSRAELVAENKKLLKDKPKGFMEKIKANAAKIKQMVSKKSQEKEPASEAAKRAKKNINEAVDKVRNKIPDWKEGNRQKPNRVLDKLFNDIGSDLDGMIKAKAERFVTNDKSVIDLTQNVDLKELQQAVKTELLADIRGFNKNNDSLYGYINDRLKNRIGDVLPELWTDMSQKDIDNLGTSDTKTVNETNKTKADITEIANVNLRESLEIDRDSPLGDYITETVEKVLSTKMPEFKYIRKNKGGKRTEVNLNEVKKVLSTNPTGEVKRQAERDLAGIYKEFKNNLENRFAQELRDAFVETFGSRADYTDWLDINAEAISDLSIDKLVAFERLVKGEKIFTEVVKENLSVEEVKQFEGTGLLVSATTNQGPTLYKKLNPTKQQVIDFFDIKGSKKGTRKDALADKISGELALNATMEIAGKPEVMEKFELGLETSGTGEVIVKEYLKDVSKAIGRGASLKFSSTLKNKLSQPEYNVYENNLPKFIENIVNVVENTGLSVDDIRSQVRQIVNDTYGDKIRKKSLVINEFVKFLKPYAKQKEAYKDVNINLQSYISDVVSDEVVSDYAKGFGVENISELFRTKNKEQRAFLKSNAAAVLNLRNENGDLIYENPLELAAEYYHYKAMMEDGSASPQRAMTFYTESAGIYDTKELAQQAIDSSNDGLGKIELIEEGKNKGKYKVGGDHSKSFVNDFIAPVFSDSSNPITSVKNISTTKVVNGEKVKVEQVQFNYKYGPPQVVDSPRRVSQEVSQDMINNNMSETELARREFDANRAFNFVVNQYRAAKELVDSGLANKENLAMMAAGMGANMKGPIRAAAMLRYLPINPKYDGLRKPEGGKAYEYEHGIPAVIVNLAIADAILNPNSKVDLKALQDSYTVGVIDVDFNDNFGAFFKQRMPFNYKIGDLPPTRWYNEFTRGGEVHELLDLKTKEIIGKDEAKLWQDIKQSRNSNIKDLSNNVISFSKTNNNKQIIEEAANIDKALNVARDPKAPVKKIRVFDFDDTLATSNNIVYANKDGKTIELNAEEFAKQGESLISEGWEMDFSDFNTVRDGAKGPLFDIAQKIKNARGNEDLFVLTARAPEAATAIYEFLKLEGLEFKKENIIGLGNSTGAAKAQWLINKGAEGYNDFYFADDAPQNVKAVKDAMEVLDVKSKVQQAKIKFSKTVPEVMNDIIFDKTGIESYKEYSSMRAKAKGRTKRSFNLIAPSAQDFGGLLYKLLAKGEKGDAQWQWMQDNLIKPFSRGMNDLSVAQNQLMADFRKLKSSIEGIPTNLKKKAFGGFTYEDITRISAWDRQGIKVDGLSKRDLQQIRDFVAGMPEIDLFVNQLIDITKGDGYHYPGGDWLAGTVTTDFLGGLRKETRPRVLKQWIENIDLAFDEKTLNKLEAAFGPKYREALEDSIRRMKTGRNRKQGISRLEARFQDYINNSVGAVMFLNARSAVLQTISAANFVNWTDNNPLKAGKAFANQKQYWTDFMSLMNSDFLVDRRNGLKINVSESEIAEAAKTTGNSVKGVISFLLNKGFVLTQFADSFAIASGGATFYRNRINTYIKQGMSKADAEQKAFLDFRDTAEESQQSARADKISQQQSSTLGRFVLAFANTPSQYARIMDKAGKDLAAGRGDWKSNISKIMYYGFVQNLMFTALQSAMFASEDEEEIDLQYFKDQGLSDKKAEAALNSYNEGKQNDYKTANSMLDNILRGIGVQGVIISTAKNTLLDLYERSKKEGQWPGPDYGESAWKLLEVSPPLSIKMKKYKGGMRDYEMNSWRPEAKEPFNINNPSYRAAAKVISAITNVPLDRLFQKMENVQGALDATNEDWQRIAMLLGWPKWQLESDKQRLDRYAEEKEGRKKYRAEQKNKTIRQYSPKLLPTKEEYEAKELKKQSDKLFKLNKSAQIDSLRQLGLSNKAINKLKYEKDRVNKIIELNK